MESFNFTAFFSLLDKEKQQIGLLSQVNLIPPQNKEVGQGASVQEWPAEQCAETSAPAVNSFTAKSCWQPPWGKSKRLPRNR